MSDSSSNQPPKDSLLDKNFFALHKGVRFECQGSGKCCLSRGEYGYVFLTLSDRKQIAKLLGISTSTFTKKYCSKTGDYFHLKEEEGAVECSFLKENKCSIYEARPTQCRTWPFWPEVMNAKSWREDVKKFCPGIGKGKHYSGKEVVNIVRQQILSEDKL